MQIYTADRYGFNNPDTIYDQPADLVVVGDSFVQSKTYQSLTLFSGTADRATDLLDHQRFPL